MDHKFKQAVSYQLHDNSSMYETVIKTTIGKMINGMPIEELEKIFAITVLDPRTTEHPAGAKKPPSRETMERLHKMHFDQLVEYTITITTATGKTLTREDIEAEGWELKSSDDTHGAWYFEMIGIDRRNPPTSTYLLTFTRVGWVLISQNGTPRFSGTVPNKNKLHDIMVMTGII